MPWLSAAATVAGLMLLVVAAGAAVLVAAGARGRDAVGAAPAVGTGVVVASALAADALALPWGVPVVAAGTVVAVLLAALAAGRLVRRGPAPTALVGPPPTDDAAPARRPVARLATAAAVAVGSLLALVPLGLAMGRPDRVQNAWDALFHLAAVDLLRAGGTIRLRDLSDLAAPGGGITYPFAWHATASLAPDGVDPLTTTNLTGLVPVVVFGVVGVAALARACFPGTPAAAPVAAVLAGAGLASPLLVAIQPGLIPNAYALALVPGALAWVARPGRVTPAALVPAVLAAAGIGLSHPGAFLGLALLAAPWVVRRCARWVRAPGLRADAELRRLVVVTVGAAGATLAAVLVIGPSPTAAAVASTRMQRPVEAGEIARRLLTGDLGDWYTSRPWVLVALVAVGALTLAARRQQLPLLVAGLLSVAMYASAASSWGPLSAVTALWYTETRRIAPLVGLTATVVAAYGLVTLVSRVREAARARALPARGAEVLAGACTVVLLTGGVASGVGAVHGVAADAFTQDVVDDPPPMSRVPYLTAAEEQMVLRLRDVLGPDDLVLGSSHSGVGHLAVLTGARAVQPYHTVPNTPDVQLVSSGLAELGHDPAVCAAVRRTGATHVYVDPHPLHSTYWRESYPQAFTFTAHPGPAARPVDQGGSASVHSLEACYADGS